MGDAVQQRRGHLGIAEDLHPFSEAEVGGDDQRGAFIELADEVEQQGTAGFQEGQIAQPSRITPST